jgi:RNA polymerase sigma-70 factor (ECF subfamily)
LRHYLSDERDRERALKRGGDRTILSMDTEDAETAYRLQPTDHLTPETLFERRWAQTVVERALETLRQQFRAKGRESHFRELKPYLTGEGETLPGHQVATRLGMSEGAVRVAIHRLRQRFGAALREEVAETVTPGEVDSELRHLLEVLQAGHGST